MQTITEALAELSTIDKRLQKKLADVPQYASRPEQMRDPLEKSGGSAKFVAEERQSFHDLLLRKVALRRAIAAANAETELTIDRLTMSVADWLVWKRECYGLKTGFLRSLLQNAHSGRNKIMQGNQTMEIDFVVNLDEKQLIEELESLEEAFGRLDGLLSLKNATTTIDV